MDTSKEAAARKVDKIIREILDDVRYKDQPIRDLSRKKIMKVVSILIIYCKLLEKNARNESD